VLNFVDSLASTSAETHVPYMGLIITQIQKRR